MAFVGTTYRLHYTAKNYTTGLIDVKMVVYTPNGIKQGVYVLSELNMGDAKGIYYYDYEDSDIEGVYLFVVNCPTMPKKDQRQVFFSDRNRVGWTDAEKKQIRDALGIDGIKVTSRDGKIQDLVELAIFLKDIEGGKWHISGNQMIFYKDDNVTEVARFNLFNQAGLPSNTNVFKRERT